MVRLSSCPPAFILEVHHQFSYVSVDEILFISNVPNLPQRTLQSGQHMFFIIPQQTYTSRAKSDIWSIKPLDIWFIFSFSSSSYLTPLRDIDKLQFIQHFLHIKYWSVVSNVWTTNQFFHFYQPVLTIHFFFSFQSQQNRFMHPKYF